MPQMSKETFLEYAQTVVIKNAERALVQWTEKLKKDPFEAFRWCSGAIIAAAERRVFSEAVKALSGNSKATMESVHEYATKVALRFARDPNTRGPDMAEAAAWAKLAEETGKDSLR